MTILKFQTQDKQNLVEKQSLPDAEAAENSQNKRREKIEEWCAACVCVLLLLIGCAVSFTGGFFWPREATKCSCSIPQRQVSKLLNFEKEVWYIFSRNFALGIDPLRERCFVFPIDKYIEHANISNLFDKMRSLQHVPDISVIEKAFNIELPAITNIEQFGPYIAAECRKFETFRLVEKPRIES